MDEEPKPTSINLKLKSNLFDQTAVEEMVRSVTARLNVVSKSAERLLYLDIPYLLKKTVTNLEAKDQFFRNTSFVKGTKDLQQLNWIAYPSHFK